MNKYKVALFDVDGVLLLPPKLFSQQYCEKYGVDPQKQGQFYVTPEFKDASLGKYDLKDALRKYKDLWKWQGSPEELMVMWFESENHPNEELLKIVEELRQSGVGVYLATQQEKYRAAYLENVIFKDKIDGMFCSCRIGYGKDDNNFWKEVMTRLKGQYPDLQSGEIVYFDDRESLTKKARELDIQGFVYTDVERVQEVLNI